MLSWLGGFWDFGLLRANGGRWRRTVGPLGAAYGIDLTGRCLGLQPGVQMLLGVAVPLGEQFNVPGELDSKIFQFLFEDESYDMMANLPAEDLVLVHEDVLLLADAAQVVGVEELLPDLDPLAVDDVQLHARHAQLAALPVVELRPFRTLWETNIV